ncbi:MAG: phospho-N-acetylmuramoyl-pentapeptide-transferase [Candidatus Nomurabacteria bacterium]|jgi:phospho-N-acetylmuramoyl-pentapeptide-transferase|nr:phospho-N-acetylmuramoyl-pentapeptide-transferase [Candidatus Nomurabacteria bacterium]
MDISQDLLANTLTRMLIFGAAALLITTILTPIFTFFAYKYKFWKKERTEDISGEEMVIKNRLHAKKHSRNIPTMAGSIFVISISLVTLIFNFSHQTYLPLAGLVIGGVVGLIDDIFNLISDGVGKAGLRPWIKFTSIALAGLAFGWVFYDFLGVSGVKVPFDGTLELGILIIPIFAFIVVATGNAVNITDGLDGLSGGLLLVSFGAFGVIALLQGNFGIAVYCFTVIGALLSYLWFNIMPARFFMGDLGSFALGVSLGVVAMLTDSLFLLPIIGGVFVIMAGSSLIQIFSKKFFHRRVFKSAPLHHHLEASGWAEPKITMRFWVIGGVMAVVGLIIALEGGII